MTRRLPTLPVHPTHPRLLAKDLLTVTAACGGDGGGDGAGAAPSRSMRSST